MTVAAAAAAAAAADETNQSAPAALEPSTLPARTFRTKSIERMMLNTRDTPKTPNYPPMQISFTLNCADGGPPMASRSRQASDPLPTRPKSKGERRGSIPIAEAPAVHWGAISTVAAVEAVRN